VAETIMAHIKLIKNFIIKIFSNFREEQSTAWTGPALAQTTPLPSHCP
jgi:hypothetical protein